MSSASQINIVCWRRFMVTSMITQGPRTESVGHVIGLMCEEV
jgi:hypothetical protein